MAVDDELVAAGLEARMARVVRLRASADAYLGALDGDDASTSVFRDERDVLVAAALASPSVAMQRETLAGIARREDRAFLLAYSVGSMFSNEAVEPEPSGVGAEAASIVLLTTRRWRGGGSSSSRVMRAEQRYIRAVIDVVGSRRRLAFPDEPWTRLGSLLPASPDHHLTALLASVNAGKNAALPVTGPDLFSIIQELCDPGSRLSDEQLRVAAVVMADWRLSTTFTALLFLRLLGPYDTERSFVFASLDALSMNATQRRHLELVRDHAASDELPRVRRPDFATRLLRICIKLSSALRAGRTQAVTDAIIEAFDLDPAMVAFMDWTAIGDILSYEGRFYGARTAFVTLLMSSDSVRRRFPEVYLATGKGAFVSDLTSLIDPLRRTDSLYPFLARFRALPSTAARHLARAVLDRPIVERITGALPRPTQWPRELPPIDTARPSMVRIDLARMMRARGLIDATVESEVMRQETEQLRLSYFKGRMQRGRVRIDWGALERVASAASGFDLEAFRSMLAGSRGASGDPEYLRRLASLAADRLADALLYESDRSLDQALSNNLRHGIVLPRVLRAFDDAFQTTFGERNVTLPVWDEPGLRGDFAGHAGELVGLREAVSARIKAFVGFWLTVEHRGAFALGFKQRAAASLLDGGAAPQDGAPHLEVCKVLHNLVESHLDEAARHLETEVGPGIMSDVRELRAATRSAEPTSMAAFLDCLETNLHEALAEICQWLQIASTDGPAIPFKLVEVVKINLLSTHLSAWSKLKVTTRCVVSRGASQSSDPVIDGRYLEMFEVLVHNLLSNAFTHSGMGLKTDVKLDLVVSESRLVVRCTNQIGEKRVDEIISQHGETLRKAKGERLARARADRESGFHKMMSAVAVATGREPMLNLPPPSARQRRFVVEVVVECPNDLIAA